MTTLDEKALGTVKDAAQGWEGASAPAIAEWAIRAYLDALPPAKPDYVYNPVDWEVTFEYADRSELAENLDLSPGDVERIDTLLKGPPLFVSEVILSRDDNGDPDETEVQFFATEEEARASSVPRATS